MDEKVDNMEADLESKVDEIGRALEDYDENLEDHNSFELMLNQLRW